MYIEPNTVIRVLRNSPLDSTYKHTLYFSTELAQSNYFISLTKYTLQNQSYQRVQKGKMRIERKADDLYDCNYIMFQNSSYGLKWFYAFITGVEYVNNITSEITFEIDVMQTWFFDYQIKPSYVEREHVLDDSPFKWLAPEPFKPSEYMVDVDEVWLGYTTVWGIEPYITMACTKDAEIGTAPAMYSGIFSGLWYYSVPVSQYQDIANMIINLDELGKGGSIVSIFMSPYPVTENEFSLTKDTNLNVLNTNMNGYIIKNKKLLQYPFTRIKLKSTDGNEVELKPELVNGTTLKVKLFFSTSMTPTITLCPTYGNVSANWDYAIQYAENPQCAWSNNVFANWQAQNLVSQSLNKISAVANMGSTAIGMAATGGLSSAAGAYSLTRGVGSLAGSANPWATEYTMSVMPGKAGGVPNGGSVNYAFERIGFEGWHYKMLPPEAKMFDDFLSVFGYAINQIKIPNRSGRTYWNYVKTKNICLAGSVPSDDMALLRNIYDSGVTFWNNGADVGNYSLNNTI